MLSRKLQTMSNNFVFGGCLSMIYARLDKLFTFLFATFFDPLILRKAKTILFVNMTKYQDYQPFFLYIILQIRPNLYHFMFKLGNIIFDAKWHSVCDEINCA